MNKILSYGSLRGIAPARWRRWGSAAAILSIVVVWSIVSRLMVSLGMPAVFLPGPGQVFSAGLAMLATPEFWTGFMVSNLRVLGGFSLAVALAIPVGVALGSIPRFAVVIGPLTDFGRFLPVAALVPLSIIWAGVGDLQKILVLAIGTFFHVLVMVSDAIRRVPQTHVDSALTLGASPARTIIRVLIPASMPQIFDACRVGVALTWSYLLVAELVASQTGLGAMIIRSQRFLQTDRILFVIFVLGLLGLAYDRSFTALRPYLFAWAQERAK